MERLEDQVRKPRARPTRQYAVVITRGASTYCATVPDLPGCAAVCRTRVEVEHVIQRAITAHLASLEQQGAPVPEPRSVVVMVEAD